MSIKDTVKEIANEVMEEVYPEDKSVEDDGFEGMANQVIWKLQDKYGKDTVHHIKLAEVKKLIMEYMPEANDLNDAVQRVFSVLEEKLK